MKVVTFGECLFRLVTSPGERLASTDQLDFFLGGTELNIAANLSSLGIQTSWVSSITDGPTGEMVRERIAKMNVDLSHCQSIPGGRPGWYLMETGHAPRPDRVFHRSASSLADQKNFSYDWKKILSGASLFHTSGVTAGLSVELTAEVQKAMAVARELKIPVSYDFNYRKNIWSIEEFVKRQKDLLPLIDFLFCADSDLELFFGTNYESIFKSTSLQKLILTRRTFDEVSYGVEVVTPEKTFTSKSYAIHSLDRIGVGDSMAAGFLKAHLAFGKDQVSAEWAALSGALKYGIKGDMAFLKVSEIENILAGAKGIIR